MHYDKNDLYKNKFDENWNLEVTKQKPSTR